MKGGETHLKKKKNVFGNPVLKLLPVAEGSFTLSNEAGQGGRRPASLILTVLSRAAGLYPFTVHSLVLPNGKRLQHEECNG